HHPDERAIEIAAAHRAKTLVFETLLIGRPARRCDTQAERNAPRLAVRTVVIADELAAERANVAVARALCGEVPELDLPLVSDHRFTNEGLGIVRRHRSAGRRRHDDGNQKSKNMTHSKLLHLEAC